MTWLALGRKHVLDPGFNIDYRAFFIPLAIALVDNVELLPEPVHRLADQFVRAHTMWHAALTVRKFLQGTHDVGTAKRIISVLQNVVHAPVTPHARNVMMRNVAMEQEITCQTLTQSGTALGLQIESFRRSDNFNVNPISRGPYHRIFHRTVPCGCREIFKPWFTLRRTGPAD